jgi:hypothetical protein
MYTCVLQGGKELGRVEGFGLGETVSELKVAIEAQAGLVPVLMRLINFESQVELQNHLTLEDAGMPNEQALADGVIQLSMQKLKQVVVADELQIATEEVTDSELAEVCDSMKDDPPDILGLCGCSGVTDISGLMQLPTISHLDISSCSLSAHGFFQLADVIKDMEALTKLDISKNELCATGAKHLADALNGNEVMTELNLSSNSLGQVTSAWDSEPDISGVAALAGVLPGMGAMLLLDLSNNRLGGFYEGYYSTGKGYGSFTATPEGPKAIADAIRDMGAISKFMFSGDVYGSRPVTMETPMVEADFSGKGLGASGAIMAAAFLPKCT